MGRRRQGTKEKGGMNVTSGSKEIGGTKSTVGAEETGGIKDTGLAALLARPAVNEVYLLAVAYAVLATFAALTLALGAAAPMPALLCVYVGYALLPVRLRDAAAAGAALTALQLAAMVYWARARSPDAPLWPQLACHAVLLLCCNAAGAFTHFPSERARRQAFLETRQCVEARLNTQRENQRQVEEKGKIIQEEVLVGRALEEFLSSCGGVN
ncbi:Adenylate cyclase [Gryllus bimaculatus]|nr:Adenylate cyclase [Gryllus bimaculatus]